MTSRVLLLVFSAACCAAQHCDPQLASAVSPTDPNRYRERDGRCEGLYYRGVSGETLLETSLTEMYEDFTPETAQSLFIEWKNPANAETSLRAYSLRPRVLYRMDSVRPAGATSYQWPLAVTGSLGLGKKDLGMVAWMKYPVGASSREVYLPLRVRRSPNSSAARRLRLVVTPGVDASEIFLSVAATGPDGKPIQYLKKDAPLGYGSYPAGQPVIIDLPQPGKAGVYVARIGATFMNSAPGHRDIWFYYPEP